MYSQAGVNLTSFCDGGLGLRRYIRGATGIRDLELYAIMHGISSLRPLCETSSRTHQHWSEMSFTVAVLRLFRVTLLAPLSSSLSSDRADPVAPAVDPDAASFFDWG